MTVKRLLELTRDLIVSTGVRHLMKEVQKNPNEEKITGVGALLAYTVRGAKGGLHSKAPELLQLMLDRTTLNGGVTMAVEGTPQKDAAANAAVSVAVVAEAIERVCQNTTREKSGVLWECLLEEVNGLLEKVSDRVKDDPVRVTDGVSAGSDVPEGADWGRARDDLARALHLLNNAVEHHRGSRVLDYRPLFALAQSLLRPPVFQEIEDGSTTELRPGVGMDVEETPTLQKETLRLLLALIASHERIAGASQGPSSVARAAATWQPAFESSNAENLIPFLQALLSPSRAYSLPFFAHSMLTSLDRLIGGHPTAVLPLLLATCRRIEPTPLANPLLLNQSGGGGGDRKNQNLVQNLLSAVAGYTAAEGQGLAEVWAAVRLLPYAESDADAGADKVWGLVQSVRAQLEESDEADVERQQSHAQGTA